MKSVINKWFMIGCLVFTTLVVQIQPNMDISCSAMPCLVNVIVVSVA